MTNVVQIGEIRISRENSKHDMRKRSCPHKNLTMDSHGEVILCDDCGKQVSAYWAIAMLSEAYATEMKRLEREASRIETAKESALHLLAAKDAEAAWRKRDMVPTCPHCGEGVFADDGFGKSLINKRLCTRKNHPKK